MNNTRQDVKKYLQQIEICAKEAQTKLDSGQDVTVVLPLSSELVINTNILVFELGKICVLETPGGKKSVTARVVKNGNYHNLRDKSGRFIKKTV